jgi:hypothetical protein
MATWKNISLVNPATGELDIVTAEVELNRRLRQAFSNIDISQILFNLNDIGGTLNLAKGGTGQALSAPAADRIMFYDKSGNAMTWLELANKLSITGTTITVVESNLDHNTIGGKQGGTANEYNHLTNAQVSNLGNQSNTNTGDETTSTIKSKLGAADTTHDGYLAQADWNTFNGKLSANAVSGTFTTVDGKTITITGGLVTSIV